MGAAPVETESASSGAIDPASIQPTEYVCFGNIEVGHPECEKCQFKDPCGKKAAGK